MIEVRRLVKNFGLKTVLRGLDFRAEPGEFVALLGPERRRQDDVSAHPGHRSPARRWARCASPATRLPAQAAAVRRRLGVVSHLPLLYGDLTAEENLRFYGRLYGLTDAASASPRCWSWSGLAPRRRDLVRTVLARHAAAPGHRARAVLHDPEVLLFDEPHTGLDQDACSMLDEVLRQVAAPGRTVVMTSHDLAARRRPGQPLRRALAAASSPPRVPAAPRSRPTGCSFYTRPGDA